MQESSLVEEVFNSVSHGFGALLATTGLVLYFLHNSPMEDLWKLVGVSIFGGSLILLYLISTLSHSLIYTKAKRVFLTLDYSAIYLLIAATYTPFLLTVLRGPLGWYLLGITWTVAIGGIVLHAIYFDRVKMLSLILYLSLGWLMIVAFKPLLHSVHLSIILLLLAGGIFYTSGVGFYLAKRLPFAHTIWHIFVIFGSACHFLAISLL